MMKAVRTYLAALSSTERQNIMLLAESLDLLALAYHHTPEGKLDSDSEPLVPSYEECYRKASEVFPEFGVYATVDPTANPDETPTMGDAIDDLADIAVELWGVAWRWDNTSHDDANWHFREGFRTHWGKHLVEVRSYVYARQFRPWLYEK